MHCSRQRYSIPATSPDSSVFQTFSFPQRILPSMLVIDARYLPATLVASFLKRLSRLSLTAPPHGIVAIIPMTYNLLKRHPTCMQMIHRPNALPGRPDPFNPFEPDPLKTGALESSLWELAVPPLDPPFPCSTCS